MIIYIHKNKNGSYSTRLQSVDYFHGSPSISDASGGPGHGPQIGIGDSVRECLQNFLDINEDLEFQFNVDGMEMPDTGFGCSYFCQSPVQIGTEKKDDEND